MQDLKCKAPDVQYRTSHDLDSIAAPGDVFRSLQADGQRFIGYVVWVSKELKSRTAGTITTVNTLGTNTHQLSWNIICDFD